jgi:hypothetical protein
MVRVNEALIFLIIIISLVCLMNEKRITFGQNEEKIVDRWIQDPYDELDELDEEYQQLNFNLVEKNI